PPLDPVSVRDLVTGRLGRRPGPSLIEQLARAAGNPLYATELVDALAEQGSLVPSDNADVDATIEVRQASLPPDLRVTMLRRLSVLPTEALQALQVAALLGTSFELADLAIGLDDSVPRTLSRLAEPIRAGWVVPAQGEYAF